MTREEAIELLEDVIGAVEDNQGRDYDTAFRMAIEALHKTEWIPVSERLPEHSYTKKFWLTVKLDDDEGTVATLIGTWGAWSGKGNKSYDAFDCWKDVMINGGIYRMSQPIPKEQVIAWMPLPEPYREDYRRKLKQKTGKWKKTKYGYTWIENNVCLNFVDYYDAKEDGE